VSFVVELFLRSRQSFNVSRPFYDLIIALVYLTTAAHHLAETCTVKILTNY